METFSPLFLTNVFSLARLLPRLEITRINSPASLLFFIIYFIYYCRRKDQLASSVHGLTRSPSWLKQAYFLLLDFSLFSPILPPCQLFILIDVKLFYFLYFIRQDSRAPSLRAFLFILSLLTLPFFHSFSFFPLKNLIFLNT